MPPSTLRQTLDSDHLRSNHAVLIALYFCFSMTVLKLLKLNNILILNLVLCVCRPNFRSCHGRLASRRPCRDVAAESQARLLEARIIYPKMFQREMGCSTSLASDAESKKFAWIQVDENGYRNPERIREAAVVVLGDSVTIAQNSSET